MSVEWVNQQAQALGISPERIAAYEACTFEAGEVYILQEFAVTVALYDLPHLPRGDDQGMSGDSPGGAWEAEEGELPDGPAPMGRVLGVMPFWAQVTIHRHVIPSIPWWGVDIHSGMGSVDHTRGWASILEAGSVTHAGGWGMDFHPDPESGISGLFQGWTSILEVGTSLLKVALVGNGGGWTSFLKVESVDHGGGGLPS
ncbi:hypothetical protein EDD17DRAFT_1510442 [Pisolithus thermaeus]|nr:hypothetical protein EV401DRAFT_1884500 [Pisolithus croceorrhizus]KAI6160464.1 hypothetical protein EDD17DRAFT_1510442 [Pisolithus thermaeus]